MSNPPTHTPEETFRSFNQPDGKKYARARMGYHSSVYESIIAHHTATGGRLDHVLDIGCGPGLATQELAKCFTHATSLDASEGMIAAAQSMDFKTSTSEPVHFAVSTAEEMAGVDDESVDLITAANAAHWFDMPAFWTRAARVLRPGGSVAVWTCGEPAAHPEMANAAALNEAFTRFKEDYLKEYFEAGNLIVQDGYRSLGMPWDAQPAVVEFERSSLWRREWALTEQFLVGQDRSISMEMLEKMWATGSPVVRWRKAHPETQGTEENVVRVLRREVERLLMEGGVAEGEEVALRGAVPGVVVMVKKVGGGSG